MSYCGFTLLYHKDKWTTQFNTKQMNCVNSSRWQKMCQRNFALAFLKRGFVFFPFVTNIKAHIGTNFTLDYTRKDFFVPIFTLISNSKRVTAILRVWHLLTCLHKAAPPYTRDAVTRELRECADTEGVSTNLSQRKPPSESNITPRPVPKMSQPLHQLKSLNYICEEGIGSWALS